MIFPPKTELETKIKVEADSYSTFGYNHRYFFFNYFGYMHKN